MLRLRNRQLNARKKIRHRRVPCRHVQRRQLRLQGGLQIIEERDDEDGVNARDGKALHITHQIIVRSLMHRQAHTREIGVPTQVRPQQIERDVGRNAQRMHPKRGHAAVQR